MTEKDWDSIKNHLYWMDNRWDSEHNLLAIIAKAYPDKVQVFRDLKYPTYLWKDREYRFQRYRDTDHGYDCLCVRGNYVACQPPHTELEYVEVLRALDLSDMDLFKLLGLNCFGFASEKFKPESNLPAAIELLIQHCGLCRHQPILHCLNISKEKVHPIWEPFARNTYRMDLYYLISYLRPDLNYSDCLKLYKAIKNHYMIPTVATEDTEPGYTDFDKYVDLYMDERF